MESLNQVWQVVLDTLRADLNISDTAIDTWLAPMTLMEITSDEAIFQIKSEFQKKIIEQQYLPKVTETMEKVLGFPVRITIRVEEPAPEIPEFDDSYFFRQNVESGMHTFDNFIVGNSNNYAYAAAMQVAKKPADAYNPLFIYGGSGLGKTHLMHAICDSVIKNNPQTRIFYVKCEDMANEFINLIQTKGNMEDFRKKYRMADILLVDDVQFLSNRDRTQEEFFHTFDALHQAHKQIVLTSDRPPREIATLSERLRGRFEMGLLADIQPPDLETRIAIVKQKAKDLDMYLPDDVCTYIATQLKSNVRQLEGAVKSLRAQFLIGGNSPTIAIAQVAVRDIRTNKKPVPVTIDNIISEVARTFNVDPEDIRSHKQTASIARARQVAFYVVRSVTELKQKEIGEQFGGFDHSTVLYSLRKVDETMKKDPTFKNMVNDIIKNLSENQ